MGSPSKPSSQALIYCTYILFLFMGLFLAWKFRKQTKLEFIHSNRTQTAIPLALNFVASDSGLFNIFDHIWWENCLASLRVLDGLVSLLVGSNSLLQVPREILHGDQTKQAEIVPFALDQVNTCVGNVLPLPGTFVPKNAFGSSILLSYPEIATIAGVQGAITYAACSALPLMGFAYLAPIIRKKSPEGFILTMWVNDRFGLIASLYLSFLTVATMFLYMVAELSALQQVLSSLTGLDPLPIMIFEVVVTTIYTSLGGFRISFITDNIQGAMIGLLLIICSIAIGTNVTIDTSKIAPSKLTEPSLLGYQLILILLVAIITNDMFISGFWMRAFASKTDKDLWIGVSLATVAVFIILVLVSCTGLIAAWSGIWVPGDYGGLAFFNLVATLPSWVVGFVIVMVCCLSCAVFDSLQSSMVSTLSNDMFRNKLPLIWVRMITVVIIIPTVIIALKSPSILRIFLISDIFSAAAIPTLLLGLVDSLYFVNGFDVIIGGLGGVMSVWIFGTIYYGNAKDGAQLLILVNGLYANDWSVFGTFVAAPVGSLIFMIFCVALRIGGTWCFCKATGRRFHCFDKPVPPPTVFADHTREVDSADIERLSPKAPHAVAV